ncbi:MAG: TolC family protein [Cyclobacteriaceae bacterium]
MAKFIISILLFTTSFVALAQEQFDYQLEKQLVDILLEDHKALDSLVDNALSNSYQLDAMNAEILQKHELTKQEKRSWLSSFQMGINFFNTNTTYDEYNRATTTASVLSNVGLSISINPERLINLGSRVKVAEYEIERVSRTQNEQRRILRNFIAGKYYDYIEALNVIEIRSNALQTQRERLELATLQFTKGEAETDELMLIENGLLSLEEAFLKSKIFAMKLKSEIELFTQDTEAQQ